MKTEMAPWRTTTVDDVTPLFERTALTTSYCTDLKVAMDDAFGERTDNRHLPKDDSENVRNLAFVISESDSIRKCPSGRSSTFKPTDILTRGVLRLANGVDRFNELVVQDSWKDEEDLSDLESTPITAIDDFITLDDDMDI